SPATPTGPAVLEAAPAGTAARRLAPQPKKPRRVFVKFMQKSPVSSALGARRREDLAQTPRHDQFFAGLHGHGYDLQTVRLHDGFGIAVPFLYAGDHAGIIVSKSFNAGRPIAQLPGTIGDGEAPGLFVPAYGQGGVAIAILGNRDACAGAGNSLNHAGDALDAEVPFAVERGKVDFTPSFDGGEAAHDLLFADLHRAADRAFGRVAVGDRGFDQIFSAEQDPGALRAAESFTAAEGVQIDAHAGVFAKIFDGRNSGGIVEQKGNASLFGDGDGTRETIAERGGIDHRRLRIDGASQIVMRLRNDKFCAHEPNGAIEGDAAAEHDDLALHAGGVGKLPDFRRIGSRHAGGGGSGHGAGRSGGDHAEFGSGELRETSAGGVLKLDQIYKMERGELLGTARFGQFERATEISPGTAGVDERTKAEAGIDIFRAGTMNGGSYFGGDCVLFN